MLEMHADRLEDRAEEREELWKAIEGLRLAEPSDITGFTEIDRAHLTFGSGVPLVSIRATMLLVRCSGKWPRLYVSSRACNCCCYCCC